MPVSVFTPNLVDYQKNAVMGFGNAFALSLASIAQETLKTEMNVQGAKQSGMRMAQVLGMPSLGEPLSQYGEQMVLSGADPMKVQESMMTLGLTKYKSDQAVLASTNRLQNAASIAMDKANARARQQADEYMPNLPESLQQPLNPSGAPGFEDLPADPRDPVSDAPPGINTWDGKGDMMAGVPEAAQKDPPSVLGGTLFNEPPQTQQPGLASLPIQSSRPVAPPNAPLATTDAPQQPPAAPAPQLRQPENADAYLQSIRAGKMLDSLEKITAAKAKIIADAADSSVSPKQVLADMQMFNSLHYGNKPKAQDKNMDDLKTAFAVRKAEESGDRADRGLDLKERQFEHKKTLAVARQLSSSSEGTSKVIKAIETPLSDVVKSYPKVAMLNSMLSGSSPSEVMSNLASGNIEALKALNPNKDNAGFEAMARSAIEAYAVGANEVTSTQNALESILEHPENIAPADAAMLVTQLSSINRDAAFFGKSKLGDGAPDPRKPRASEPFTPYIDKLKEISSGYKAPANPAAEASAAKTAALAQQPGDLTEGQVNSLPDYKAQEPHGSWTTGDTYVPYDGDSSKGQKGWWSDAAPMRLVGIGAPETDASQLPMMKQQAEAFGLTMGDVSTVGELSSKFVKALLSKYKHETYEVKSDVAGALDKSGHRKMVDVVLHVNGRKIRLSEALAITGLGKPQITGSAGSFDGRTADKALMDMMLLYGKSPIGAVGTKSTSLLPSGGSAPPLSGQSRGALPARNSLLDPPRFP